MSKTHVKKGQEVVIISGAERGKRGKVISVASAGDRVIIEGIKMIKCHTKKSQQHPQGAIIQREGTVHISNVMTVTNFDARASKRGSAETKA
ncbi:MAG: 50S ribosomal protein L24 [Verrucomicrobia bacterium]|jgi:large subunit ribosomal protein L24|nr:MAG: 50S ribosomal protein L24 [Verrucomicrobiota bacterium]MCX6882312.1 50S ribosomal protein L24 [Verrucomicrobiota bacterium]